MIPAGPARKWPYIRARKWISAGRLAESTISA